MDWVFNAVIFQKKNVQLAVKSYNFEQKGFISVCTLRAWYGPSILE